MSDIPRYYAAGLRLVIPATKGDVCYFKDAADEIERLESQVNQLKQFQESLHPTALRDYSKTYYVIDNDQIDAAWNLKSGPALATLAIFNIFRCEHRPFGGVRSIEPGEHLNEKCPVCAKFTGHGWVIGGEND